MKTYTSPTLVLNGSAMTATLNNLPFVGIEGPNRRPQSAGSIGYYL